MNGDNMIYAVVKDGVVINRIIWDGVTQYTYPEDGCSLVQSDTADIGDLYDGENFTKPIIEE